MSAIILLVILVVIAAVLVGMYNTLVQLRVRCDSAWSDIDVQLKRRHDLIPNLVETVKGYAKQESSVLEAVTNARARATSIQVNADTITDPEAFKKFQDAQTQLSGALGRLLAVSENYPDLKSNQNFLALQSQIEGTENRIAVARRDYIEAVRVYNTELRTFPGVVWASTLYKSNKAMQEFTVAEDVKQPPQIKF